MTLTETPELTPETFLFPAIPGVPDMELAKFITLNGPRSVLEWVHNGGMIPRGEIQQTAPHVGTIICISTLTHSIDDFKRKLGSYAWPRAYWKDPQLEPGFLKSAPEPIEQEFGPRPVLNFTSSLLSGVFEVPELVKHRIPRRKTCYNEILDSEMKAINISITNYVYARLILFRAGIHYPEANMLPAPFRGLA